MAMQLAVKRPASDATNNDQTNTTTYTTLPPVGENQSTAPNAPITPPTVLQHSGTVESEERDDGAHPFTLPSSRNQGSRRLIPDEIMELQANDDILIVVPIDKPRMRLKNRLISAELSK